MNHLATRLRGFGTTIFAEMTRLAEATGSINLGQGFPDFDGPEVLKEAACRAIREGRNQYARSSGVPPLAQAIAGHQRRFYGLACDPDTEVTVTSGATEAIFATLIGLLDPGDEVVVFEPFYDSYLASLSVAGALPRVVTLRPPSFELDLDAVRAATTRRTRAILLNTPHNPTGKVFSRDELEGVAAIARERDLIVVADEVYEHLTFDREHIPIATLDGMRERTVTISSTGKTFSLTGWKVGWACAPEPLTAGIRAAHQFITFCGATPLQHAMAEALALDDAYFEGFRAAYRRRRDLLCAGLRAVGFGVLEPQGTYFVLTDIRPLGFHDDLAFCRSLPERAGVVAIPPTAFYANKDEGRHLVRWAFCKTEAVLEAAIGRLKRLEPV